MLIGSLLVAAVQGYGIASTLEEMRNVVGEPGPEFRLMAVTTFVAATALLVWLAAMISRHGLGAVSGSCCLRPISPTQEARYYPHMKPCVQAL